MPPIPRKIHFVFGLREDFGGKPWSLCHHLAVRSAAELNGIRPTIWVHHEPGGEWWERTRAIAAVGSIDDFADNDRRHSGHHAHRGDLARLWVLTGEGGAYLDADTLCVRPFPDRMWAGPATIGFQAGGYLCNGVILAPVGDPFILDWAGLFSRGDSPYKGQWDGFACRAPRELWETGRYDLRVEHDSRFHTPSWTEAEQLFEPSGLEFPAAVCHHLWETVTWDRWLKHLTPDSIRGGASPYARMARRFLD